MGEPQLAVRALVGTTPSKIVALSTLRVHARDQRKGAWYVIHPELLAKGLGAVPGIQILSNGLVIAHRTHLPLISQMADNIDVVHADPPVQDDEAFDQVSKSLGFQLRPYQQTGRRHLRKQKRVLLADQQRLGKTVQVMAAHELSDGPMVVVAPLATRTVWTSWFKRRFPGEEPAVLRGNTFKAEEIVGKKLIFLHYNILRAWQSMGVVGQIGSLVLDEVHIIANHKNIYAQGLNLIAPRADKIFALSGTPLWNEPSGLWGILNMLNPGAWSSWFEFATRYCGGMPGPYGFVTHGVTNTDEIAQRMTEVMFRRTWKDVAPELPPIERTVEVLDLDKKTRRQIDMVTESLADETDHKTYVGKLARYRKLVGEVKIERAIELGREVMKGDEPVVIWTWHVDLAKKAVEAFEKMGFPAWCVTGRQSQDQRDANIEAWRSTRNGALVVTMAVGQAGIDLSHSRIYIFAELDWTPAVLGQAEMRTFSIARPMSGTYLTVDHEADQRIVDTLRAKLDVADQLRIPAADAAIDVIGVAFGKPEVADLGRLMLDVIAGDDGSEDLF